MVFGGCAGCVSGYVLRGVVDQKFVEGSNSKRQRKIKLRFRDEVGGDSLDGGSAPRLRESGCVSRQRHRQARPLKSSLASSAPKKKSKGLFDAKDSGSSQDGQSVGTEAITVAGGDDDDGGEGTVYIDVSDTHGRRGGGANPFVTRSAPRHDRDRERERDRDRERERERERDRERERERERTRRGRHYSSHRFVRSAVPSAGSPRPSLPRRGVGRLGKGRSSFNREVRRPLDSDDDDRGWDERRV